MGSKAVFVALFSYMTRETPASDTLSYTVILLIATFRIVLIVGLGHHEKHGTMPVMDQSPARVARQF